MADDTRDERLQRLQEALNRDQLAFNHASIGKRCQVLVERRGRHAGQWLGKSPWLQSVHFTGEASLGSGAWDFAGATVVLEGQNLSNSRRMNFESTSTISPFIGASTARSSSPLARCGVGIHPEQRGVKA